MAEIHYTRPIVREENYLLLEIGKFSKSNAVHDQL